MDDETKALAFLKKKEQYRNYARLGRRVKKYKLSTVPVANYVVLDFKTTGFRAGADRIIQIGALKYVGHKLVEQFHTYINPERYVPREITSLTGISHEVLAMAPTIEQKIDELIAFIDSFPIVAHQASFDMSFLYAVEQMIETSIPPYTVIDTVMLVRRRIQHATDHDLSTLVHYLELEDHTHDALQGCQVTTAIYQHCIGLQRPLNEEKIEW